MTTIADKQSFYRDVGEQIRTDGAAAAAARLRRCLAADPEDETAASLLGSALLKLGRTEEALAGFRDTAARHPSSFAAHGDLGYACLRANRPAEARESFAAAVALNPDFYQAWCYLSRLQYQAGDTAAAKKSFRKAADCDPLAERFREVQAAMSASRYAEAEKRCRELLARQPGYPRAAYTLAHLASQVGAFEEASRILEQALEHYPADVNLRAALVVSFEDAGRYASAVAAAEPITALDPEVAASWLILGRVHGHCGHYDACLECYERALERVRDEPREAGNIELLRGHVLKILGRHDEGIAAYRASIERVPSNGAGWWGLADMKTFAFTEEDVAAMRAIAGDAGVKAEQRAQAAFALGKAEEDGARHDAAFDWYRRGNELRAGVDFDPAVQRAGIDELRRVFDAVLLSRRAAPSPAGPRPIFIVGLPRSGSTLIEQILASHPDVEGTMELASLPNLVRRIRIDGGHRGRDYPASMASFEPAELSAYGQAYLDDTAMYRTDRPFFIDKLPTNFDKIGLIHMILPQAIVVDARRHPLDCGFSCYKQHFAGGHPFSYDLEHIGHYYNAYLAMMDHWDAVLPGKVLLAAYEQVVDDTETAVRRLLAHCGLDFDPACLRFFENRRPVRTASSEQVRQPIYRKGIGHWKHFEPQLAPLIVALGGETLGRFEAAVPRRD